MNILAIDDEELTQAFIKHVLQEDHTVHLASNGEQGIQQAHALQPDIIILDVKMPGMDGYTVCRKLKQDPATADIPVVFLSANTTLEEQLQGYAAGGDDYLSKTSDPATLRAKIDVMLRYRDQQYALKQHYQEAQKTAHIAMIGSSEIGMVMQIVKNSYLLHDYAELAKAFFTLTDQQHLVCAIMFFTQDGPQCFFSDGVISPLENALLEKMRNRERFFDYEQRTFINFPNVSLLVKNMPLGDPERYGRIKDLLPVALGALSNKLFTMMTEQAMQQQSDELAVSFDQIKTDLLSLGNSLSANQSKSVEVLRTMLKEMQEFLPRLALDEDQESYILDYIEQSTVQSLKLSDSAEDMNTTFHKVINQLQSLLDKHQAMLADIQTMTSSLNDTGSQSPYTSDVDLF